MNNLPIFYFWLSGLWGESHLIRFPDQLHGDMYYINGPDNVYQKS